MPRKPALTTREFAVLRLLAQGQKDKAIARELGISARTVEHYVGNVLSKLLAETRTEAVRNALADSLIKFDVNSGEFS